MMNATIPTRMTPALSRGASKGFSLIELLVVLLILGLIATLVLPNVIGRSEAAKWQTAQSQVDRLAAGVDTYYMDNNNLPRELRDLVHRPANAPAWTGPYVRESLLNDPWDRPYNFRVPGESGRPFDIYSHGRNGSPGGEGPDRDIRSWD